MSEFIKSWDILWYCVGALRFCLRAPTVTWAGSRTLFQSLRPIKDESQPIRAELCKPIQA